jgi:hypothetical protein
MSPLATMAQQVTHPDTTVASTPAFSLSGIPSLHKFDARDIRLLPVRGMDQLLSLVPGVIYQNGELHFRGGRAGEVRYLLDGHAITNAFTARPIFEPIPEALEEINVSTGVSDARLGRALSGQVLSTMKTGGQRLEIFGDLRTDEFVGAGKEFLGTTSFGHRDAILTVGGPMPFVQNTRFFLAGRHVYLRNRQPRFVTPFSIRLEAIPDSDPFPGPLVIDQATFANNTEEQNVVQGNIVHEDGSLQVQLTGHYGAGAYTLGSEWPSRIQQFYNQRRNSELKTTSAFLGLTGRYAFTPLTSLEVRASYGMNSTRTVDPDFGETWTLYPDSVANAAIGYAPFDRRWGYPISTYHTDFSFNAVRQGMPPKAYSRQSQSTWSTSISVDHWLTSQMKLSVGVDVERWRMRMFSVADIYDLMWYLYGRTLNDTPRTFATAEDRRWLAARLGQIENYGYDVDGNSVDDGPDSPFHPSFASGFVSHVWQSSGFTVETGMRYEYYNPAIDTFRERHDLHLAFTAGNVEIFPQESLVESEPHHFLLPRLRAWYRTENATQLFLSIGSFAQMPSLDRILHSYPYMLQTVSPSFRGFSYRTPIGLMVQPERCSLVEAGAICRIADHLQLGVTAYLKSAWDLITVRKEESEESEDYPYYANDDKARMKGVEISLSADNGFGFRGYLSYALSEVRGNGAHPGSSIGYAENPPSDGSFPGLSLLEYNQTHRGTFYLSFRGDESAGPILEGSGLTLLMTYNFGHNRTQFNPSPYLFGFVEPMMSGVGDIQDPRFTHGREVPGPLTTPAVLNIDLSISKQMQIGGAEVELYAVLLNVLNTKHVLNAYPLTGSSTDDGSQAFGHSSSSCPVLCPCMSH